MLDNEGLEMLDAGVVSSSSSSSTRMEAAIREAVEVVEVVKLGTQSSAGILSGNEICIIEKICTDLELESSAAVIVVDCLEADDCGQARPLTAAVAVTVVGGGREVAGNIDAKTKESGDNCHPEAGSSSSGPKTSAATVHPHRRNSGGQPPEKNSSDTASEYLEA